MSKLSTDEIQSKLEDLSGGWQVNKQGHLYKEFSFDNFMEPLSLANQVAPIAEDMQHHPDLTIRWGTLGVEIWSHDIDAISEKDFTLARKIQDLI